MYLPVSSTGARSSAPSGPRPTGYRRGQGYVPSQSPSRQTGSSHNPIVTSIYNPTDPWFQHMHPSTGQKINTTMQRFSLSVRRLRPTTFPFEADFPHSPPAPLLSEVTEGTAPTVTTTHAISNCVGTHSLMQTDFELGHIGHDDAYRRW